MRKKRYLKTPNSGRIRRNQGQLANKRKEDEAARYNRSQQVNPIQEKYWKSREYPGIHFIRRLYIAAKEAD